MNFFSSAPNTLLQHRFRQLCAREPGIVTFVLSEVLKTPKLFEGQHILGGLTIQSFGIDIQATRRLFRSDNR